MDFHFLVLFLLEIPNFLDYKILVQVKHVHMLDRLEQLHRLEHYIYNHANEIKSRQDSQYYHEEMDNVEKLFNFE